MKLANNIRNDPLGRTLRYVLGKWNDMYVYQSRVFANTWLEYIHYEEFGIFALRRSLCQQEVTNGCKINEEMYTLRI